MDLRTTFNDNAQNYDSIRPSYPFALFHDIREYSKITSKSTILEIGIGTGQATYPFLKNNYNIIAIELGSNLAHYTKNKFKKYNNFSIINTSFEEFNSPSNTYDLIYSATAFHWINPYIGLSKVKRLLKAGGTIALFWNHPFPNRENDPVNVANRLIYNKYRPSSKPIVEFTYADCKKWENTLRNYNFTNIVSKLYHRTRTLNTENYIRLLNTYSDHISLPTNIKEAFENDMKKAINNLGGKINIYDTIDLYLARKE